MSKGKGKSQNADIESRFVLGKELGEGGYVYCDGSLYPNVDEKNLLKRIKEYY